MGRRLHRPPPRRGAPIDGYGCPSTTTRVPRTRRPSPLDPWHICRSGALRREPARVSWRVGLLGQLSPSPGTDLSTISWDRTAVEWWRSRHVGPSLWAKGRDRVRRIKQTLGELPVTDLDYRVVTEWQAKLGQELAPRTVRLHRQVLAQMVDEAVKMGALVGNPVRSVKPLRVPPAQGVALTVTRRRRCSSPSAFPPGAEAAVARLDQARLVGGDHRLHTA